ncbi:MAG: type III-A CRISPR-associated protein Csm2 [Methanosarcinales archaeon]
MNQKHQHGGFKKRDQKKGSKPQAINMNFLDNGYYQDEKKEILRENLIVEHADKLGKEFARSLTSAQLRRFFNDVRALEARVESSEFNKQLPIIKMLKSKVAYAKGRDKIPAGFKDFIDVCIDKIEDKKDFEGFVKLFESVVGFYYFHGGK